MSDEPDEPDSDISVAPESTELFLSEDEFWFPNAGKTCERLKIDYLQNCDGTIYAGISGVGEVQLAKVLSEEGKVKRAETAKLASIK